MVRKESALSGITQNNPIELNESSLIGGIHKSLDDDQAQEILTIDLRGKSAMADYMVVASGRSQRHVGAVADHLLRHLKESGLKNIQVEGLPNCDWVLVDAGDVVVHIFRPEVRDFYNLEKMWGVDLPEETVIS